MSINSLNNPYYQKVNHVRLAKNQMAKGWIDYGSSYGPDVVFDSIDKAAAFSNFSDSYLQMGAVSYLDETGSGGKKFLRYAQPVPGASDSSMWLKWNFENANKDGRVRYLVRMSGTAPAVTTQRGPEALMRCTLEYPYVGKENSYAVGPWAYSGSQRQRIRRLIDGVITSVQQLGTDPPFVHGDWYWIDVKISGSQIASRLYLDGAAVPASPNLQGTDATFAEGVGVWGFDGRFSNNLLIDIAEVHWEPLISLISAQGAASNAILPTACKIGDLILLQDCNNTATGSPALMAGFTSALALTTPSSGATACRVSYKFAAADNESVPVAAASVGFRQALVYRGVDPTTPVQLTNSGDIFLDTAPTFFVDALSPISPVGKLVAGIRARGSAPDYNLSSLVRRSNIVGASTNGQAAMFDLDVLQSGYAGESFANITAGRSITWALALNKAPLF